MMSFESSSGLVDPSIHISQNHKRRIDDDNDDLDHFFKKRLLDTFQNLKIFEGSKASSTSSTPPEPTDDTVYIDSIDQFLKDNPDKSDLHSSKLTSADELSSNTTKEIVIPEGLLKPINELFNQESQNQNEKFLKDKKRETVEKLMARKRMAQRQAMDNIDKNELELDLMLDEGETYKEPEIQISNEEIYYETYVNQYWSIVKYYNPPLLILRTVQKWFWRKRKAMFKNSNNSELDLPNRVVYKSPQIEEIDDDGDNVIMSDDDEEEDKVHNSTTFRTSTPSPSKIRNNYGDYYGEDGFRIHDVSDEDEDNSKSFNNFFNNQNFHKLEQMDESNLTSNEYGSFYSSIDPNETADFDEFTSNNEGMDLD